MRRLIFLSLFFLGTFFSLGVVSSEKVFALNLGGACPSNPAGICLRADFCTSSANNNGTVSGAGGCLQPLTGAPVICCTPSTPAPFPPVSCATSLGGACLDQCDTTADFLGTADCVSPAPQCCNIATPPVDSDESNCKALSGSCASACIGTPLMTPTDPNNDCGVYASGTLAGQKPSCCGSIATAPTGDTCPTVSGQTCRTPDCRGDEVIKTGFTCTTGICCGPATPGPGPTPGPGSGTTLSGGPCPANFVVKAGVCFPPSGTLGLSDMSVYDLFLKIMNWLLAIIGVLAVIAFVISGVQYLVSAGNEEMATTAKRNMTYAMIGIAVALAGLIIVNAIAGLLGAGGATNY